ncbi:MAG: hypothetical protein JWN34_1133 [Bryobacterales bacterium]|jgi:hypothetical protein|nr:hypothetical protein [Bryobacterales bacterium]
MSEEKQQNAGGCGTSGCLCGGNGPKMTALLSMMMPSGEAGTHFRQAHIELLKGLRALIDQRIESLAQPAHGTKLNVD